jgi:hypothetical protein
MKDDYPTRVSAMVNWGPCNSLSEVRAFLGTMGVVRIYIKDFAYRAHALIILTKKNERAARRHGRSQTRTLDLPGTSPARL